MSSKIQKTNSQTRLVAIDETGRVREIREFERKYSFLRRFHKAEMQYYFPTCTIIVEHGYDSLDGDIDGQWRIFMTA